MYRQGHFQFEEVEPFGLQSFHCAQVAVLANCFGWTHLMQKRNFSGFD